MQDTAGVEASGGTWLRLLGACALAALASASSLTLLVATLAAAAR